MTDQVGPRLERGARVTVKEPGLEPWAGTVIAVKPAAVWRVEVRRDDGATWSLPAYLVKSLAGGASV